MSPRMAKAIRDETKREPLCTMRVHTYISIHAAYAADIKYSARITSPRTESYIALRLARVGSAAQT